MSCKMVPIRRAMVNSVLIQCSLQRIRRDLGERDRQIHDFSQSPGKALSSGYLPVFDINASWRRHPRRQHHHRRRR